MEERSLVIIDKFRKFSRWSRGRVPVKSIFSRIVVVPPPLPEYFFLFIIMDDGDDGITRYDELPSIIQVKTGVIIIIIYV